MFVESAGGNPAAEKSKPAGTRRAAQWRMLFAMMFCYLFYYTGRQNFGWAVPLMLDDEGLGLSATQLGALSGTMLLCYGIGQSINGNLGDKFGGRIMVTLGGLLSGVFNWITSFGSSFFGFLFPLAANGFAQSMGWAPGSRLISNWWSPSERGKAFGWYVASSASSSIVIFAISIVVITYLPWRWIFRLPVLLLVIASLIFYLIARNRPEDLGFEPVEEDESHADPNANGSEESSLQRYGNVLRNVPFLGASVSMGFISMARYGLLTWVPLHYMGKNWEDDPSGLWITLALPIGMALGALTSGYVSDRFFNSNRSKPIAVFLAIAIFVMLLIYLVPVEMTLLGMVLLFLAGFLVYGPQSCYWALCPDLFGRYRAATAVGIMNCSAYVFAAVEEPFMGWVIDSTGSTAMVFAVLAIICTLAAVSILPVRR